MRARLEARPRGLRLWPAVHTERLRPQAPCRQSSKEVVAFMWSAYPNWLNPGDNAWQMTAATLVGLMSVPGLVVLYGGVMQKRWSVNSMMLAFTAFAVVLIGWVLWGFHMAFGS